MLTSRVAPGGHWLQLRLVSAPHPDGTTTRHRHLYQHRSLSAPAHQHPHFTRSALTTHNLLTIRSLTLSACSSSLHLFRRTSPSTQKHQLSRRASGCRLLSARSASISWSRCISAPSRSIVMSVRVDAPTWIQLPHSRVDAPTCSTGLPLLALDMFRNLHSNPNKF